MCYDSYCISPRLKPKQTKFGRKNLENLFKAFLNEHLLYTRQQLFDCASCFRFTNETYGVADKRSISLLFANI